MNLTCEEFQEHCDSYDGYCTHCKEVTRFGMTEPDARNYPCPDCGKNTCMGIEWALLEGEIDITD